MNLFFKRLSLVFLIACSAMAAAKDQVKEAKVDFINYQAELTPDLDNKSVNGKVTIRFVPLVNTLTQLTFSAQFKHIQSVTFASKALDFSVASNELILSFPAKLSKNVEHSITIAYQATPPRGMKYYDDHLFTVYHTKNWLVSHDNLSDKATFDLTLTHDDALTAIGNGTLVSQHYVNVKQMVTLWRQTTPMPLYTFGFALGHFKKLTIASGDTDISVYYREQDKSGLTETKLRQAFKDVTDMRLFFENKAGFGLNQNYAYVVVDGYMAQEASGFSLVGEKFVHTLLGNQEENWFIAHELAHEWWGNSITSVNFSHFWLNEGLVVFLVAAYKQHLFGEAAYNKEIALAYKRVQRAVKEKRIAPVAFRNIIKEQDINRTMAYSKGALVFHMLREQLGDKVFWQSLKQYSLIFKGQSVTSQNLKSVFEAVSGVNLTPFFEQWVYGQAIPKIDV